MRYSLHKGCFPSTKKFRLGIRFSRVSASQDEGSHAISRQKYLELPVVQKDGRVDERKYGHVTKSHYQNFSDAWITNFSCLGAPLNTSAFVLSNF